MSARDRWAAAARVIARGGSCIGGGITRIFTSKSPLKSLLKFPLKFLCTPLWQPLRRGGRLHQAMEQNRRAAEGLDRAVKEMLRQ
mgnify:CR=1 FL=1